MNSNPHEQTPAQPPSIPPTQPTPPAESQPTAPIPPVSAPTPPYPVSTPPGYPAGYPVSTPPAFPASAPPGYPLAAVPASEPKKGPWALVFGILSLVLLLAAGGVGYLYYAERGKVGDRNTELAGLQEQIEQLRQDLKDVQSDLQDALDDAEACRGYVQDFMDFIVLAAEESSGDPSNIDAMKASAAVMGMIGACDVEMDFTALVP